MTHIFSDSPRALHYAMPPEWALHSATWMSWPFDDEMWHGHLREVRREYAQFVRKLSQFEPVHLLVRDAEARASASEALQGVQRVQMHELPLDDVWLRDNGPIFVTRPEKAEGGSSVLPPVAMVNWEFNAWGDKYDWSQDNEAPEAISRILDLPYFENAMIMEGGSLDINGEGVCLTTEQCLLSPKRNPHASRADIEKALYDFLGQKQIVWLKLGLEGDHTDGHIDTITRFASADTVLHSSCLDRSDINWQRMEENKEILQGVRLADGRSLKVIDLPLPQKRLELADGTRLPPTYANFYIANGAVLVPQYGDPQDEAALSILRQAFPRHQVIGLASRYIITGGGSFHCLTQQQPAKPGSL